MPFDDESFDIVINSQSFHHYPNPVRFFQEVYRVLKPGENAQLNEKINNQTALIEQLQEENQALEEKLDEIANQTAKSDTIITLDDVTGSIFDDITLTAYVVDSTGDIVSGGRVEFKVNGNTLKDADGNSIYVNVFNGIVSVSVDVSSRWMEENTITAIFGGNSIYDTVRGNSTMTITE